MRLTRSFLAESIVLIAFAQFAHAVTLPRVHSYSGFMTPVLGDIRTVGMAGNGIGDTFISAANNPSGLAESLNTIDTTLVNNAIHDSNVQGYSDKRDPGAVGAAVMIYPYAFSLGIWPTGMEGVEGGTIIQAHEFRAGVARTFFDNKLSLGLSLNIGVADEEDPGLAGLTEEHAVALGATFGATYRLPERFLLGLALSTPMHYSFDPSLSSAGFFEPMDVPVRGELSLSWIPNMFLRGDFRLSVFGTTKGAALLSDDSRLVGETVKTQPALGLAYIFFDYPNLTGTLYGGSYYEFTRIEGASDRTHGTAGLEFKIYCVTAGLGLDHASGYSDFLYSIGIDVGLVGEYLRVIPHRDRPTYQHFLPDPTVLSDQGLPRPLVATGNPSTDKMDPLKIVEQMPQKLAQEVKRIEKGKKAIDLPKERRAKVDPKQRAGERRQRAQEHLKTTNKDYSSQQAGQAPESR